MQYFYYTPRKGPNPGHSEFLVNPNNSKKFRIEEWVLSGWQNSWKIKKCNIDLTCCRGIHNWGYLTRTIRHIPLIGAANMYIYLFPFPPWKHPQGAFLFCRAKIISYGHCALDCSWSCSFDTLSEKWRVDGQPISYHARWLLKMVADVVVEEFLSAWFRVVS